MKCEKLDGIIRLAIPLVLLATGLWPARALAQQASAKQAGPAKGSFDFETGPSLFKAYSYPHVPAPILTNSPQINNLIQGNKLELSLANALELALQNNLDIAVARYQLPLARLDILRTKSGGATRGVQGAVISNALFTGAIGTGISGFTGGGTTGGGGFSGGGVVTTGFVGCCDSVAGFSVGLNNNKTPLNYTTLLGIPVEGSHTSTYSTFFGKGFLTGTSFSAAVTGTRSSTTSLSSLYNPSVPTTLTVGLNQHLLKGFGRRANGVFIRIARNDLNVADSVFRQRVITTVAQVLNAYYQLLADRDQVRVAQSAVGYSQQLVEDDKKQVEIGTMAPLDVVQAQSELATDQQNVIVAETTYLEQQETLKTLIAKRVGSRLASAPINPTDTLPIPENTNIPPLNKALEDALRNRPELHQAELNLRNQYYVIQSNRNGLLPSLNAFATYQSNGLAGLQVLRDGNGNIVGTVPGGLGDSLGQIFGGRYPSYSVGLTLSVPIRNRAEQANAAQALVEQHEMETALQREKNQVAQDVRNAEIAVTQAKAQIHAAVQARVYARQALDAEVKKLRQGVSTTLNVILMQRNLITAEGNEAKARQTFAQALVRLGEATGTILDQYHIIMANSATGRYTRQPNIPGDPASVR